MLSDPVIPASPPASPKTTPIFSAGTLRYTKPALFVMMAWLLWGDFCFSLMESVFPALMPLKLHSLETPNWLIALIMTTIPSLLNATVCPVVSFWSDRHRSPLGRRIPFILYTIPFICACLILIGLAPWLAGWLTKTYQLNNQTLITLGLLGAFAVGFQFFNMFVQSVYYYLFNDIVPPEFLGRFLAIFRFVGTLAGSAFSFFVLPHAETHFPHIFIGAAILYGIVFFMMCRKVKEGEYPPPPPQAESAVSRFAGIKTFFVESFSHRFYWYFYLFTAFTAGSAAIGIFQILFARSLGVTLTQFGQLAGTAGLVIAALLIPCGFLSDKFHPIRTARVGLAGGLLIAPLSLVFLFFDVPANWVFPIFCTLTALSLPFGALYGASELPLFMRILPRERFGQFSAATALVRSLVNLSAGILLGLLLDFIQARTSADMVYRYLPFWTIAFQGMGCVFLWLLFSEWKKRGGDTAYTPPAV